MKKSIIISIIILVLVTPIIFIETKQTITGNTIYGGVIFKPDMTEKTRTIYEDIYKSYNKEIKDLTDSTDYIGSEMIYALIRETSEGKSEMVTEDGCIGIIPLCYSTAIDYDVIKDNLVECSNPEECLQHKEEDYRFKPEKSIEATVDYLEEESKLYKGYSNSDIFTVAAYTAGDDLVLEAIRTSNNKDPKWSEIKKYITPDLLSQFWPYNDEEGYYGLTGKIGGSLDEAKLQKAATDIINFVDYFDHYSKQAETFLKDKADYTQKELQKASPVLPGDERAQYDGLDINYDYFGKVNKNGYIRRQKIDTIVIHHTAGTLKSTPKNVVDGWKVSGLSAHYIIDRNGDIYQIASENRVTFHAGCNDDQISSGICYIPNINKRSIGIEIMNTGFEEDKFDDVYPNLNKLLEAITKEYNIPYDNDHILAHYEIFKQKVDPSLNFNWAKINLPDHPNIFAVHLLSSHPNSYAAQKPETVCVGWPTAKQSMCTPRNDFLAALSKPKPTKLALNEPELAPLTSPKLASNNLNEPDLTGLGGGSEEDTLDERIPTQEFASNTLVDLTTAGAGDVGLPQDTGGSAYA